MTITDYINNINTRYKTGITTEHSFRGDLQQLIESTVAGILATNEPSHIACGAPDYVLTRKNIPIGYIEAKDIDADLKDKNYKEQFDRYRNSLTNLLFTDYLDFHFYKNGEFVSSIRIAHTEGKKIVPNTDKLEEFIALLKDFCTYTGQTIKSSKTLAEMMAGKARMLANVIENALHSDEQTANNSTLNEQLNAFKDILIHDIKAKEFADIYAQTIAYGMFAARLHDTTLDNFSRQEAAELIPKSNPFLRKLFGYIAGPDIDDRIVWIVDALADIFRATDIKELLKNFGKATQQQDPIIHFYETFLAEYDPKLRKARGVWYTPEPVVNFIVRAVDDILKTEFNLPEGLADRSKTKVKIKSFTKATADQRSKVKEGETEIEVHKVQILDPATGTGTFLAEVIKQIHSKFEGQQGLWSNYVEEHLIPRINGFELLMASYAMAHLKLDLLLTETGYKPKTQNRLRVYLTNSLEEHHPDTGTLFANWLSTEANEANHIKRDTPVMVVMGNPPYSGESANSSPFIYDLINDYKKEHTGEKLKETNTKWLNNDYLKFLRLSQYFIDKNGEGILGFITSHSYLDSPTFRGVRFSLLQTFDKIFILNLNGHQEKKLKTITGSKDENVFDIKEGVSIILGIKHKSNNKKELFYNSIIGDRNLKYNFLFENELSSIKWIKLNPIADKFLFVENDNENEREYNEGFSINQLFQKFSTGVLTKNDDVAISYFKNEMQKRLDDFNTLDESEIIKKYRIKKDSRDWKIKNAMNDVRTNYKKDFIKELVYRPFDTRYTFYSKQPKGFCSYTQFNLMQHIIEKNNVALITTRINRQASLGYVFITKLMSELHVLDNAKDSTSVFPLYLYPSATSQTTLEEKQERTPNLNKEIVEKIATGLGLQWVAEKEIANSNTFAPIDILDYIYAVLHSPAYREKYKEFLKIDFPRVPYPKDKETFWQLVTLGSQLRQLHLLESPAVNKPITQYPVDGDNKVGKIRYENEKVWINETQYFDKVLPTAWNFYIGGYQPAQKWLKDRKDRILTFDDILHYQKIIVALNETDRLMKEVDKVNFIMM